MFQYASDISWSQKWSITGLLSVITQLLKLVILHELENKMCSYQLQTVWVRF